jgi:hypothetical protein
VAAESELGGLLHSQEKSLVDFITKFDRLIAVLCLGDVTAKMLFRQKLSYPLQNHLNIVTFNAELKSYAELKVAAVKADQYIQQTSYLSSCRSLESSRSRDSSRKRVYSKRFNKLDSTQTNTSSRA